MHEKKVILKEGKEKPLLHFHPWIFSGAIASLPECVPGEVLPVYSSKGAFLALAYFNPSQSLIGRVLSFSKKELSAILEEHLLKAIALREKVIDPKTTTCYRLINAEGDGLSGLIVDIYADVAVIQVSTSGMERLKSTLIALLQKHLKLRAVYEKSSSSSRSSEGLPLVQQLHWGSLETLTLVKENDLLFYVDIVQGQKTGFFLDQKEMRSLVERFAKGRVVLNAFSYSGGFSLYALRGGAKEVVSVDRDAKALVLAEKNAALNGFSSHESVEADVFCYLDKKEKNFDFIILDPPAFAKKQKDIPAASKGYYEINKKALAHLPSKSFLLTSSCSYYIDHKLFQQIVFQAAVDAKREVKILSHHLLAKDHPILLSHLEGHYLKSLFLYIE